FNACNQGKHRRTMLERRNEWRLQHQMQGTALNSSAVSCTVRVVLSRHTGGTRLPHIDYISVIKMHFGTNLPAGRFGGRTAHAPAILEDGGAREKTDGTTAGSYVTKEQSQNRWDPELLPHKVTLVRFLHCDLDIKVKMSSVTKGVKPSLRLLGELELRMRNLNLLQLLETLLTMKALQRTDKYTCAGTRCQGAMKQQEGGIARRWEDPDLRRPSDRTVPLSRIGGLSTALQNAVYQPWKEVAISYISQNCCCLALAAPAKRIDKLDRKYSNKKQRSTYLSRAAGHRKDPEAQIQHWNIDKEQGRQNQVELNNEAANELTRTPEGGSSEAAVPLRCALHSSCTGCERRSAGKQSCDVTALLSGRCAHSQCRRRAEKHSAGGQTALDSLYPIDSVGQIYFVETRIATREIDMLQSGKMCCMLISAAEEEVSVGRSTGTAHGRPPQLVVDVAVECEVVVSKTKTEELKDEMVVFLKVLSSRLEKKCHSLQTLFVGDGGIKGLHINTCKMCPRINSEAIEPTENIGSIFYKRLHRGYKWGQHTVKGFICPLCMKSHGTAEELFKHYEASHEPCSDAGHGGEVNSSTEREELLLLRREVQDLQASLKEEKWYAEELKKELENVQEQLKQNSIPDGVTTVSSTELQSLEQQMEEARTEIFNIKQMKDLFEQKAAQLATELVELKASRDEEKGHLAAAEETVKSLNQEIQIRSRVIEDLKTELLQRPGIEDVAVLKKELIQVQTLMDKTSLEREKESEKLKDECKQLQMQNANSEATINRLKTELQKGPQEVAVYVQELQQLKSSLAELSQKNETLVEKLLKKELEFTQLEEKQNEEIMSRKNLQINLNHRDVDCQQLQVRLSASEAAQQTLKTEVAEKGEANQKLKEELSEVEIKHQNLKVEFKQLQQQREEKVQHSLQQQSEINQLHSKLLETERQLGEAHGRLKEQRQLSAEKLMDKEQQVADLQLKLSRAEEQVKEQGSTSADLQHQLEKIRQQHQEQHTLQQTTTSKLREAQNFLIHSMNLQLFFLIEILVKHSMTGCRFICGHSRGESFTSILLYENNRKRRGNSPLSLLCTWVGMESSHRAALVPVKAGYIGGFVFPNVDIRNVFCAVMSSKVKYFHVMLQKSSFLVDILPSVAPLGSLAVCFPHSLTAGRKVKVKAQPLCSAFTLRPAVTVREADGKGPDGHQNSDLEQVLRQIGDKDQKIQNLEALLEKSKKNISVLEKEREDLCAKIESGEGATAVLTQLQEKNHTLQEQLTQLTEKLKNQSESHKQAQEDLHEQVQEQKSQLRASQDRVLSLETTIEELTSQLNESKEKMLQLDQQTIISGNVTLVLIISSSSYNVRQNIWDFYCALFETVLLSVVFILGGEKWLLHFSMSIIQSTITIIIASSTIIIASSTIIIASSTIIIASSTIIIASSAIIIASSAIIIASSAIIIAASAIIIASSAIIIAPTAIMIASSTIIIAPTTIIIAPTTIIIAPPPSSLPHHHHHCPTTIIIAPPPSSLPHHHHHCPTTIIMASSTIIIAPTTIIIASPPSSLPHHHHYGLQHHHHCPHHHHHCPTTIIIAPPPSSLPHHHHHCPTTIIMASSTIIIAPPPSSLPHHHHYGLQHHHPCPHHHHHHHCPHHHHHCLQRHHYCLQHHHHCPHHHHHCLQHHHRLPPHTQLHTWRQRRTQTHTQPHTRRHRHTHTAAHTQAHSHTHTQHPLTSPHVRSSRSTSRQLSV
ncbi:unnamed protein product, partial [Ranitomeya imitator]